MPGSEAIETVFGANQPEYQPLPAVYLDTPARNVITRWRLTEDERLAIAAGADIVMQQLTFWHPYQPSNLQVVMPDANPEFVQEP
jgi:hypothetical protein